MSQSKKNPLNASSYKFATQMATLKAHLDEQIEIEGIKAKIIRAKYLALVKEGFTSEQAVELCKGNLFSS